MDKQIQELTLLLLYLTSWKEEDIPDGMKRSWKGYPFHTLDNLVAEDWIRGSKRSKSVYLTKMGVEEAELLMKKYNLIDDNQSLSEEQRKEPNHANPLNQKTVR